MNVNITQETAAKRPTPDSLKSSVLDHALKAGNVLENARFGLRNNEGLWPSYNMMDTLVPTPICPAPQFVNTFGLAEWVPALEFAVHGGAECKALGLDRADQKAEVARVFGENEGKGIEQALLLNRFVATGSDEFPAWGSPVNLTPAGAPTGLLALPVALALLEGYAAANYAGVPTIHMPRAAATLLGERIVWQGDLAFTRNGSKVAMGGGYDVSESDGSWDLYATGEVYIERSGEITVQSIVVPGEADSGSDGNGLTENAVLSITERMYRVAVDGFVAKSTAHVW